MILKAEASLEGGIGGGGSPPPPPRTTKIGPSRRAKLLAGQMFSTNGSAFFSLFNCNKKVGYACNFSVPKDRDYQ